MIHVEFVDTFVEEVDVKIYIWGDVQQYFRLFFRRVLWNYRSMKHTFGLIKWLILWCVLISSVFAIRINETWGRGGQIEIIRMYILQMTFLTDILYIYTMICIIVFFCSKLEQIEQMEIDWFLAMDIQLTSAGHGV